LEIIHMPSFLQRRRLGAILFVFIVLGASMALAQDNPQSGETPWQDDTSNWCDGGNVWGDGRCNTDDGALTDWMYDAGWWFQRVTEGDISPCEMPENLGGGANCTIGGSGEQSITINTPAGPITFVFYLTGRSGTDIGATCNATCQANGTPIGGNDFNFEADSGIYGITNDTSTRLVIHGNDNDNFIVGSYGDDTIYGNGGIDVIYGDSEFGDGSGNDTIDGGAGNDTIFGDSEIGVGSGDDTIDGGLGDDQIFGDSLFGIGSGTNTCTDSGGDDTTPAQDCP
jgi:Ca2+-binding RTX toxin-like protein